MLTLLAPACCWLEPLAQDKGWWAGGEECYVTHQPTRFLRSCHYVLTLHCWYLAFATAWQPNGGGVVTGHHTLTDHGCSSARL
ncbi:hypothetical protein EDB19DRAFT_1694810, partial [Suillus lakei]